MRNKFSDITLETRGIIAHVVNRNGTMGAGVAKAIATRWPTVADDYKQFTLHYKPLLGTIHSYCVSEDLLIVHMYAMKGLNESWPRLLYVKLASCLESVAHMAQDVGLPVLVPYGIGCGLAGGNWEFVKQMIDEAIPNATVCHPTMKTLVLDGAR